MFDLTYTLSLNNVLRYAKQEAERIGSGSVGSLHLLLALLREDNSLGLGLLRDSGVDLFKLRTDVEMAARLMKKNDMPSTEAGYTEPANRVIRFIDLETIATKQKESNTKHLILAIMKESENKAGQILRGEFNLTYDDLFEKATVSSQTMSLHQQEEIRNSGFLDAEDDDDDDMPSDNKPSSTTQQTGKKTASKTPALDKFGINLTQRAADGKLDPVIGRQKEIERVVQILSRRKKNNPVLIGEPGVGKSSIVEGLALRIVNKEVSPMLFNKRIYTLDLANMVAGTKYRGQFEERMKSVLNDLQQNPDVILFIDEIHTIIGAGNASGSLDAANILKPALSRGDIQCIGATTLNEYRQSIEKDGALERRFQKVIVPQTTKEETIEILRQLAPHYAQHHHVTYTDDALVACVNLTDRYITDRAFPDKAIDALDEAGASMRIGLTPPAETSTIKEIQAQIDSIKAQKQEVLLKQDFETAVVLRDKEQDLNLALQGEMMRLKEQSEAERPEVTEDDIARVVSLMSGVPIERLKEKETIRLRELGKRLQAKVIGQDEAIDHVVRAIQRSRVGLGQPTHPIGTFLFLGPTGVGKTYLAQCLAEEMFGSRDALIRIDMSEYMEKHAVSLLVGAPPGYVGHEDGGKLTEAVRRRPYSIVLFDEIEKAHPDVFNILLQLLDEGRLTDRQGRVVDFRQTVIILTSNSGTRQLREFGNGIGFHSATTIDKKNAEGILRKSLHKTFAPEFLNRIDNIVIFDQLSDEAINRIVDLELEQPRRQLRDLGYDLLISDDARAFLRKKGYDVQYGARPIKRAIQTYVLDAVTDVLLSVQGETKAESELKKMCIEADGDDKLRVRIE